MNVCSSRYGAVVSSVRIAMSAALGPRLARYSRRRACWPGWSAAAARRRVNSLVEVAAEEREANALLLILLVESAAAASRDVDGSGLSPTAGRKKGACSGALGASLGLLRARITSRCSRVCHLLLGTRLRVVILALSWSM